MCDNNTHFISVLPITACYETDKLNFNNLFLYLIICLINQNLIFCFVIAVLEILKTYQHDSEIYHELEAIDADKAPARAGVILAGLGFTPQMQSQCTKHVNTTLAYTSVTAKLYYKILFDFL